MILTMLLEIARIIIFLASGAILSYLLFPKTDVVKRFVYSLALSASLIGIFKVLLYILNITSSLIAAPLFFLLLILIPFVLLKLKNNSYKTLYNKDLLYILLFSLMGTLWKFFYLNSIKNMDAGYSYAFQFARGGVPDLGYYTGMALVHSNYNFNIQNKFIEFLSLNQFIEIFLATFLFLGFIYIIFNECRNRKLALIGVALMALGPIELFYLVTRLRTHDLGYAALFSLFLFYKSKEKNTFWLAFFLSAYMMFSYYTSTLVLILASLGFILAVLIKELIQHKKIREILKNRKIWLFIIILLMLCIYLEVFTTMNKITTKRIADVSIIKSTFTSESIYPGLNPYEDPTFLSISAMRWQVLFFFLCGLTFVLYLFIKKDLSEENRDLVLCLIPIVIITFGFFYTNYLSRIFNYFAFFGLLALKIPKKYLKTFLIFGFIFILITGFYVAKDKKIFFENSNGEIEAASWVKNNLDGKVFSDQKFINLVILNGYYNITGTCDKCWVVKALFYNNNLTEFISALNSTNSDYVAITKRMQEKYILMVDYPQKPVQTAEFFEQNLEKIYDNGDVKIYKTKVKKG